MVYAKLIYAIGETLLRNMVLIIEKYYLPSIKDKKFSIFAILKIDIQRIINNKPEIKVNILYL